MPFVPFHEKFPEIAEKETRSIIAIADPELPEGNYALLESYCNEIGCGGYSSIYFPKEETKS